MSKFRIGQQVYVKSLGGYGTVSEIGQDGNPKEVWFNGRFVKLLNELVVQIPIWTQLVRDIINLFKRR